VLHDRLATAKCKIGTKIAMTISEFPKVLSEILKNEACHHIYIQSVCQYVGHIRKENAGAHIRKENAGLQFIPF